MKVTNVNKRIRLPDERIERAGDDGWVMYGCMTDATEADVGENGLLFFSDEDEEEQFTAGRCFIFSCCNKSSSE